ncbi:glycosyltransferase involved in cell wall biosynthesis [Variovorax sp. TBS-050B]|uniref:glycosyltransferase n=1 Tax=Variovorax sp. TBS-050B TaxID=2940551 RepID=UPI002475193D|nr:glycosyltransferase [Variovorax sp. TBS-050B]MDH6592661.1 glycosyltransferase involved in cell wall biosynthesis [Variovorax sp. TBS-050B]
MDIDLTIVLNCHNEDNYITRTLSSVEEAAMYAEALGIALELVIVLDKPTNSIRSIAESTMPAGFKQKKVIEVENGSLGLSRNDGAAAACGEWLFLQDADDLISYNGFAEIFFSTQRHGPRSIHICETLIAFGVDSYVVTYFDAKTITPLPFVDCHPFVSRICCPRRLLEELPFADLRLTKGYAYEDWFFNAEALSKGYSFHAAPNAIFFYRQRDNSLLRQANALSARQIPPSGLFKPLLFLRLAAEGYARFKSAPAWRERLIAQQTDVNNPVIFDLCVAANRIDPQIHPAEIAASPQYNNLSFCNVQIGIAYYEMCRLIGGKRFDDVFVLPSMGVGGGERYLLDVMHALNATGATANSLVFLGQSRRGSNWLDRLPTNSTVIDFELICPELDEGARILLTLKAIEACAGRARLHLKQSQYAHAFARRYLHLLKQCTRIYYRFADECNFVHGRALSLHHGFELVSALIDEIDIVVADNQFIIDEDRRRLGRHQDRWCLLYAREPARTDKSALAESIGCAAPAVAWAGRLDHQKRPGLLPLVAARLRERQSELTLHIFGTPVLNHFCADALMMHANVRLHGEFASFEQVLSVEPMCFLLTSLFEGVPNVLLEATARGLPIVAPDVGGVSEVVEHGLTGILLPSLADDDSMANLIADALIAYADHPQQREEHASNALTRLQQRNGPQAYAARIAEIFFTKND